MSKLPYSAVNLPQPEVADGGVTLNAVALPHSSMYRIPLRIAMPFAWSGGAWARFADVAIIL